jgi:GntR family transcriptional regulator
MPLYYQLEIRLRKQIEEGSLKPGDPLPAETTLANDYDVSRITVRRALDRLEEDGLIARRQGKRTRVSPNYVPPDTEKSPAPDYRGFEDELRRLELHPVAEVLEATIGTPTKYIANLLTLSPNDNIVRIRRRGWVDDKPIWLEARYFPAEVGKPLLEIDPASDSILNLLANTVGVEIEAVDATIKAVVASKRQADLLDMQDCSPLILHESITMAKNQKRVQVLQAFLRADYYQLKLEAAPADVQIHGRTSLVITGGGYLVGGKS